MCYVKSMDPNFEILEGIKLKLSQTQTFKECKL